MYNLEQTKITSCDQILDLTECNSETLPSPLNCFWLYSELTGNDGRCEAKDASLTCGDAKRVNQCPLDGVSNLGPSNCFWLYNGDTTSGEGGSCKAENDASVGCGDAKRSSQCNSDSFKSGNCLWLEGNSSRDTPVASVCELKVLLVII
jgi:hypothetical protein